MEQETIIEKIDSELLNLHDASQNKSNYLFFDFHQALKSFNECILKENNKSDYLRLKAKQYLDVFSDLLFTLEKSHWVEYISYDTNKKVLTLKEFTHFTNPVELTERIVEKVEKDEHQHKYLVENIETLKQKIPKVFPVCKYHYLLENCNSIPIKEDFTIDDINKWTWFKNFKNELNSLFSSFSFDIRMETTFEKYIEKLQFQKELMPTNQSKSKGYETTLKEHRIINLYNASKEYISTEKQNLINVLKGKECNPIIWKSNAVKLRAFIVAIFQNPKEPRTISKKYFRDINNKVIGLSNVVNSDKNYQYYIEEFTEYLK